ncbi:hypothetical protein HKX48_005253 [Thoreauomyces humboldtii]|nr:hypothetical protein HKX48_005253 [Thoreauomyces humboldtii]
MVLPRIVPVLAPKLAAALSAQSPYDGLLVIFSAIGSITTQSNALRSLAPAVLALTKADASAATTVAFLAHGDAPGSRVVLSPTGNLRGDVDDVRRFTDAARSGLRRIRSSGSKRPLVILPDTPVTATPGVSSATTARLQRDYSKFLEVTLLGLLAEAYVPLQAREHSASQKIAEEPFEEIGIAVDGSDELAEQAVRFANAVDEGRRLAKDVGGSDPERMTPLRAAEYIEASFKGTDVTVSIERDVAVLKKEYPFLHAVARASLAVPRHFPAVVRLEYHAPDQSEVKENIFLVGKGVTYDTGGLDIKAGGWMRGMSRDKCGATGCAGFLKTVALLKPRHVNVIADLGFVRNSCGADGYVSDEIIVSRAGVRALIGNTDAEGRMVMTDLLCLAKERALSPRYAKIPSRLMTVATLTGHAVRAVGPYGICLDNGPAREDSISTRLVAAGHIIGDPFERSTLRREDYNFNLPGSANEDVVQANDKASSATNRGHQSPAAFMAVASGLSPHHGLDTEHPIAYTHLDIAGSAEEDHGVGLSLAPVTGAPVAALVQAFLV